MHHDENTAAAVQAKRDPAIFLVTVRGIKDGERLRIMKIVAARSKLMRWLRRLSLALLGSHAKIYRNASPQLHDIMVLPPAAGAEHAISRMSQYHNIQNEPISY